MKKRLRKLVVPLCTLLILSSCLALAGYFYNIAYRPLFDNGVPIITPSDYDIPHAKLDMALSQLETKTTTTVDVSTLRNPFAREGE